MTSEYPKEEGQPDEVVRPEDELESEANDQSTIVNLYRNGLIPRAKRISELEELQARLQERRTLGTLTKQEYKDITVAIGARRKEIWVVEIYTDVLIPQADTVEKLEELQADVINNRDTYTPDQYDTITAAINARREVLQRSR